MATKPRKTVRGHGTLIQTSKEYVAGQGWVRVGFYENKKGEVSMLPI